MPKKEWIELIISSIIALTINLLWAVYVFDSSSLYHSSWYIIFIKYCIVAAPVTTIFAIYINIRFKDYLNE